MKKNNSIWGIITAYKLNSIFIKYFMLVFFLIVTPLLTISMGVYYYYSLKVEKEISYAYERSLFKIRDTLDIIFADINRLSLRLTTDNEVIKFLEMDKYELNSYENIVRINSVRSKISILASEYIDSLYLYSGSSSYIVTSSGLYSVLTDFYDNEWYNDYLSFKENTQNIIKYRRVSFDFQSRTYKDYITLLQTAPFSGLYNLGAVVINIDASKFDQFFGEVYTNNIEDIYIVDEDGKVLFNKNISYIGYTLDKIPLLNEVKLGNKSFKIMNAQGELKLVSYTDSNKNKFRYISIVSLDESLRPKYLKNILLYSVLAGIVLSTLLAFVISISVYRPFGDIISIINNSEQAEKLKFFNNRKRYNEVKFILSKILDFNLSRKNMELNLAQYLTMLRKTQFIALQSQINPHFLYNTLCTINWMAIGLTKSENEVSHMITNLSDLLRLSFKTHDNLITIKDEVMHAKKYIEIERIRFDNMFDVVWDIDEDIKEFMIIKITLQPIIENAIYHGLKKKKEKGIIIIRGVLKKNIEFYIEDNGVGMEAKTVETINSEFNKDYIKEDYNIGLRNVNQRIKLVFGEEYGVTVKSERFKDTRVKIVIPKVK